MRLAVIVEAIDAEAAMAPVGALSQSSTGAVTDNRAYTGAPPTPRCGSVVRDASCREAWASLNPIFLMVPWQASTSLWR